MTSPRALDDLPEEDRPPLPARRRPPAGFLWAVALGTVVLVIAVVVAFRTEGGTPSGGDQAATTIAAGGSGASGALVGQRLPTAPVETFDGTPMTLAQLAPAGKPAVLNFFASWCVPCVTEMPELEALHQAEGDTVAFVGINVNDGVDNGRATVGRTGVTYQVVRDPLGDALTAVGGVNMPTTVVVKPDGTIAKVKAGQISRAELEQTLREIGG